MMNPRVLFRTTATILVFGLASVTGSQADQSVREGGSAKQQDKATQPQQQEQQQKPSAQKRQQRPPAQDRQAQSRRQARVQKQSQAERPTTQRQQSKAAVRSPQRQSTAGVQSRSTSPTRRVTQAPTQMRTGARRAEHQRVWPRYRANNWTSQHRTWSQRGGYTGYRIPSRQFILYFGRSHRFHLSSYQIRIVGAYPQFYADGFWFTMLDPVPEYWGNDWYDTDYVTVIESQGGYYLLSEEYPDVQLAISVHL